MTNPTSPISRITPQITDNLPTSGEQAGDKATASISEDKMVLIESGVHTQEGGTWRIGELNTTLLNDPQFAKEANAKGHYERNPSRLEGRVKMVLSELSEQHNKGFLGKIRTLASAIKRLFTFTHPSRQQMHPVPSQATLSYQETLNKLPTPSQAALSYQETLNKLPLSQQTAYAEFATAARGMNDAAFLTLTAMDKLHTVSRQIPEMAQQIREAPRNQLSDILEPGGPFTEIVSRAKALGKRNIENDLSILAALSHKSGLGYEEKVKLEKYVNDAIATIDKVLNQRYVPNDPKLEQAMRGSTNMTFENLTDPNLNPYQSLSEHAKFNKVNIQELRAWISQGLQVIEKASQMIASAVINQERSMSLDNEYQQFTAIGKQPD